MFIPRLISFTVLTAAVVLVVWTDLLAVQLLVAGVCALALAAALAEFFQMTAALGLPGYRRPAITVSVLLVAAVMAAAQQPRLPAEMLAGAEIMGAVLLLAAAFYRVFRAPDFAAESRRLIATLAGFLFLTVPLLYVPKTYFLADATHGNGRFLLLFLLLVTKFGDVGGYVIGKLSAAAMPRGNHKLVPRLSPKKSWEGFIGSIVGSVLMAGILHAAVGARLTVAGVAVLDLPRALIAGAVLAVVGLFGDLTISALKRGSGIKDSGHFIPGLGGALDTLDSLILAAPLFYVYLRVAALGG